MKTIAKTINAISILVYATVASALFGHWFIFLVLAIIAMYGMNSYIDSEDEKRRLKKEKRGHKLDAIH